MEVSFHHWFISLSWADSNQSAAWQLQTHCPAACHRYRARPPCFLFCFSSGFHGFTDPTSPSHFGSVLLFLIVPSYHTGQNTTAINNYANKPIQHGEGHQVSWCFGEGEWLMHEICYVSATTVPPVLHDSAEPCHFPQRHVESIFPPLEPGWTSVASSTKRIWESGRLGGRRHDSPDSLVFALLSLSSRLETSHSR